MLLEAGADPDRPVVAGGQQTLRMAASVGHGAAVRLLIGRGARINGDPNDLRSPLGEAIYWQQRAIVVQLLEAGASTAKLYVAAGVGQRAAVEAHFDASGALHFAALRGGRSAIDYLLSRGANTALRDRQYSATPDGWAEYNGHPELADLIRAHARAKGDST